MTSFSIELCLFEAGNGARHLASRVETQCVWPTANVKMHIERSRLSMVMDTLEDGFALIQRNDAKLGGISGMRTSWVRDIFLGVGDPVYGRPGFMGAEGRECTCITCCLGFGRVETPVLMVPRSPHLTADPIGY